MTPEHPREFPFQNKHPERERLQPPWDSLTALQLLPQSWAHTGLVPCLHMAKLAGTHGHPQPDSQCPPVRAERVLSPPSHFVQEPATSGFAIYFKLQTFQLERNNGEKKPKKPMRLGRLPCIKVSHVFKAVNFKKAHN